MPQIIVNPIPFNDVMSMAASKISVQPIIIKEIERPTSRTTLVVSSLDITPPQELAMEHLAPYTLYVPTITDCYGYNIIILYIMHTVNTTRIVIPLL